MPQYENLLKARIDRAIFCLWTLERYCHRMPCDTFSLKLCEDYRRLCEKLLKEYTALYAQTVSEKQYIWQRIDTLPSEDGN